MCRRIQNNNQNGSLKKGKPKNNALFLKCNRCYLAGFSFWENKLIHQI